MLGILRTMLTSVKSFPLSTHNSHTVLQLPNCYLVKSENVSTHDSESDTPVIYISA